jgi:hypothetical protein
MVSGQITCHCGQSVPGWMADAHLVGGVRCSGIREELHVPGVCLDCKLGTHSAVFLLALDVIRFEKGLAE